MGVSGSKNLSKQHQQKIMADNSAESQATAATEQPPTEEALSSEIKTEEGEEPKSSGGEHQLAAVADDNENADNQEAIEALAKPVDDLDILEQKLTSDLRLEQKPEETTADELPAPVETKTSPEHSHREVEAPAEEEVAPPADPPQAESQESETAEANADQPATDLQSAPDAEVDNP